MQDYIISSSYANFEDEWEVDQLNQKLNWFLTKDSKKDFNEIDRSFYKLCCLMEENGSSNPSSYSVIQFYGKLDYINSTIERENENERDTIPS